MQRRDTEGRIHSGRLSCLLRHPHVTPARKGATWGEPGFSPRRLPVDFVQVEAAAPGVGVVELEAYGGYPIHFRYLPLDGVPAWLERHSGGVVLLLAPIDGVGGHGRPDPARRPALVPRRLSGDGAFERRAQGKSRPPPGRR